MNADKDKTRESVFPALSRTFGAIEQAGVRIGVAVMVTGFVLYVSGALAPFVSVEKLVRNWGSQAEHFVRQTGLPTGWGWTRLLGHSDMLALAGLILLSSAVIAAYLGLIPRLARERNRAYLLLVVLQLGVFALAASGVLGGAH